MSKRSILIAIPLSAILVAGCGGQSREQAYGHCIVKAAENYHFEGQPLHLDGLSLQRQIRGIAAVASVDDGSLRARIEDQCGKPPKKYDVPGIARPSSLQ